MTNEELCIRYQHGDNRAGSQLWDQNQGLVRLALHKMQIRQQHWDDAESAAAEGFLRAMKRWRPSKGAFSGYAVTGMVHRIRQEFRRPRRTETLEVAPLSPTCEDVHLSLLLQSLPPRERKAAELRIHGHNWDHVAGEVGIHRVHLTPKTKTAVLELLRD